MLRAGTSTLEAKAEGQSGADPHGAHRTIAEWHGFYGAVAGVGATLVGVVFVAISIHVARSPADARTRRLAVMSAVNLSHPMAAGLIMLMPVTSPVQGAVLVLLALNTLGATVTISAGEARRPQGQN